MHGNTVYIYDNPPSVTTLVPVAHRGRHIKAGDKVEIIGVNLDEQYFVVSENPDPIYLKFDQVSVNGSTPTTVARRWFHENFSGVRCTSCGGSGERYIDEGQEYGGVFLDACYKCGTTGYISYDQWQSDRLESVASKLAQIMTERDVEGMNSNPDGEGLEFRAAECMCSPWEYEQDMYTGNAIGASEALNKLAQLDGCKHRSVLRALVELVSPSPKPKFKLGPYQVTFVRWLDKVDNHDERRTEKTTQHGQLIRFDPPTESYLVERLDGKFVWVSQNHLTVVKDSDIPDKVTTTFDHWPDPQASKKTPTVFPSIVGRPVPTPTVDEGSSDDIPF